MKEYKKALKKAIESGETELMYSVLLEMKDKDEKKLLYQILKENEFYVAKNLFFSYCKEQDLKYLKLFLHSLELDNEAANIYIFESFLMPDLNAKKKLLSDAKSLYKNNNVDPEVKKLILNVNSF
jgi:hypothetical protein